MTLTASEQKLVKQDQLLIEIVKNIKILSHLSWPIEVQQKFLVQWRKKQAKLPEVSYPTLNFQDKINALKSLRKTIDRNHPIGRYLHNTASSYITACHLLENLGKDALTQYAIKLYGKPGKLLTGSHTHNIEAAEHFIKIAHEYENAYSEESNTSCVSAESFKASLQEAIKDVFTHHTIKVEIDEHLAAKATAGASRIRLRGGNCYTPSDYQQLLEHEAFVHTLTAVNGQEQPYIKSLGLGSPRTTATQEGLATFAELVTGAIDIHRMERIALRIIAVDKALNGADFLDVFKFFLSSGEEELESFNSTMRVFRGVPVTGGAAFTKDTVYLHGLMSVHTFFRWAIMHNKLNLCKFLFAGRMTVGDVVKLEPYFSSKLLNGPLYLPPWMTKTNGLAGYLAFSVFTNKIHIHELHETYF